MIERFLGRQEIDVPPVSPPSEDSIVSWLAQHGDVVAAVLVAIAIVGIFRSLWKSKPGFGLMMGILGGLVVMLAFGVGCGAR